MATIEKRAWDVFSAPSTNNGELDIVGNLADFAGKNGKLRFNTANLARKDKAVVITVVTADGKTGKIYGSKNVSAAIRAKSITTPQLLGLRVSLSETGEDKIPVLKLIGWESDSQEILVTDPTKVETNGVSNTVSVASFEELAW